VQVQDDGSKHPNVIVDTSVPPPETPALPVSKTVSQK